MKLMTFVLGVLICGCATTGDPFMKIQPGMQPYQVKEVLGDPVDRKFANHRDEWIYHVKMGKGVTKTKIVFFDNNRVLALGDDELALERQFELARARAGAPKVETVPPAEQGTSSAANSTLPCKSENKYGAYAEGGGCNQYGCWGPGGSCNQYGCSLSGECSQKGCPQKVSSFQCTKQ